MGERIQGELVPGVERGGKQTRRGTRPFCVQGGRAMGWVPSLWEKVSILYDGTGASRPFSASSSLVWGTGLGVGVVHREARKPHFLQATSERAWSRTGTLACPLSGGERSPPSPVTRQAGKQSRPRPLPASPQGGPGLVRSTSFALATAPRRGGAVASVRLPSGRGWRAGSKEAAVCEGESAWQPAAQVHLPERSGRGAGWVPGGWGQ